MGAVAIGVMAGALRWFKGTERRKGMREWQVRRHGGVTMCGVAGRGGPPLTGYGPWGSTHPLGSCRHAWSVTGREARLLGPLGSPSSDPHALSRRPCSAERLRFTPACRTRPAARPPARASSPRYAGYRTA